MDGEVHAPFVFLNSSYLFSILQKKTKQNKTVTLDPRHGTLDMTLVSGQGTSAEQCDEKPTIAALPHQTVRWRYNHVK